MLFVLRFPSLIPHKSICFKGLSAELHPSIVPIFLCQFITGTISLTMLLNSISNAYLDLLYIYVCLHEHNY